MRKLIYIITFSILSISMASAQNIIEVINTMPNTIITNLDAAQKDLLISNPDDTTGITISLDRYGELKRLAMTADFIAIKTSDAGSTQIKLLPLINDSKIICVVKTVYDSQKKVSDSQMQFYTTKWMPIPGTDLFPKVTKEWFIKPDVDRNSQDFINAYAAIDMDPVMITLSSSDYNLSAQFMIKGYLSDEEYKKVQPYLIEEPKIFLWDRISYKSTDPK
ncbi:hypothetical protein GGR21_002184 [Dysgonomonas hofstadii]|uniref:DUF3256 family protein n=1 Tax=Dysgonomonas hofstadii TaxID=637886 RepID=A0A840CUX9_9BACT|nr:DUF3256 family protein [Dysgonomonas hofstadii]MBB4036282.1 hypothetical protein [Dysgonomonas hofstadii]